MRVVIQRVSQASVKVKGVETGKIEKGLLVLAGFEEADLEEDLEWISKKICGLRIFPDEQGIMNLSVSEVSGDILVVSQFTLHASTRKGNRPSYIKAARPEKAGKMYNDFLLVISSVLGKPVQSGVFGGDMKVLLLNDGPVTIIIDSKIKE